MALRVLLADESTTIKKVMQLALQDFAVEVKAVHVGIDVVEVARAFKPDIVFADVLLQKRNGYEVCGDLKKNPETRALPVVLMWSSFMELDENLASNSGADQRLEKPFDVEHLRSIVLELVPKTRSQRLAHFLQFPGSFTEPLKEEERQRSSSAHAQPEAAPAPTQSFPKMQPRQQQPPHTQPPQQHTQQPQRPPVQQPIQQPVQPKQEANPDWNMESFEDIEEFAARNEQPQATAGQTRSHVSGGNLRNPSNEEFSEFKIAPLAERIERTKSGAGLSTQDRDDEPFSLEDDQEGSGSGFVLKEDSQPRIQASDDEETWSHQDLSRFKVDLEPISLETEDDTFDLAHTVTHQSQRPSSPPAGNPSRTHGGGQKGTQPNSQRQQPTSPKMNQPSLHSPADEEFGGLLEIEEVPMGLENDGEPTTLFGEAASLELDPTFSGGDSEQEFGSERGLGQQESVDETADFRHSGTATGSRQKPIRASIPELSSDELERIVRAQSRETIEALVRKIVPDLAARIIREELERLLEENP